MRGLAFYRPEFLWALFFLAAVLAIHLLRRPRVKTLDFSTLRFFQSTVLHASRMRRLRRVLQLLLRLAAAALVIALFAAPFNRNDRLSMLRDPHLTLLTWIDRTPAMAYAENGASLIGRSAALLDSLALASPATVKRLDFDEARSDFMPHASAAPPQRTVRHGGAGLARVLAAWDENRGTYSLPLLLLCSDFQKETAASLDSLLRERTGRSQPNLICAMVTPESPWNYSVRAAELQERAGASVVHSLVTTGNRPLDSGELSVTIGSIRCGTKKISLPANDSAAVDIEVPAMKREGGCVTLATNDPLPFDNTCWFTARRRAASGVLIIGDSLKNAPVAAAVAALSSDRFSPVSLATGESVTADGIDSAAVIIINGLGRQSSPVEALRQGRAFGRKVIVVALSGSAQESSYAAGFLSRVLSPAIALKEVSLAEPATVVLPDTISEVWRGFPELRSAETAVYRYTEGLPGTVLLRLNTGAPLVTSITDRDNRTWILFATPLGITDANNLCETGFFVPCIDRLLRNAAAAINPSADPWFAGVPRKNPFYGTGKGASVAGSDGTVITRWQSQPMVAVAAPGLYRITPDGGDAYSIAVNADPAESRLLYTAPRPPAAGRGTMAVLTERQILDIVRHHGRLPAYLPWIILALLFFSELLLWEKPEARSDTAQRKN